MTSKWEKTKQNKTFLAPSRDSTWKFTVFRQMRRGKQRKGKLSIITCFVLFVFLFLLFVFTGWRYHCEQHSHMSIKASEIHFLITVHCIMSVELTWRKNGLELMAETVIFKEKMWERQCLSFLFYLELRLEETRKFRTKACWLTLAISFTFVSLDCILGWRDWLVRKRLQFVLLIMTSRVERELNSYLYNGPTQGHYTS